MPRLETIMEGTILVTGATGAIGRNLVPVLREDFGTDAVIAGYHSRIPQGTLANGPMVQVNVADKEGLQSVVTEHNVKRIYHLAALLSVAAEKDPQAAEEVNTRGLQNVLDVMKSEALSGFWASSIAVYGTGIPKENVSEDSPLNPITVYGKGKVEGEKKISGMSNGVDMRVLRFPGLNGPGKPGPGTTEYAIEMIQAAASENHHTVPLREDTAMPMMDMRDAVRGITLLMNAPAEKIRPGKAYNIAAFSFSPQELYDVVKEFNSAFTVTYEPDEVKQKIADSWPCTIDDSRARTDWGWKSEIPLRDMVKNIFDAAST